MMRKPGLDIFHTFNDIGLAVASKTGGAQQPWFSSSPIKSTQSAAHGDEVCFQARSYRGFRSSAASQAFACEAATKRGHTRLASETRAPTVTSEVRGLV